MKLALTFLAMLACSTSLFAQSRFENLWKVPQQVVYQPDTNSGTVQPRTVPEPEPQTPPPPPPQTQPVVQQPTPFQSLLMSRRDFRLARTPPMFGDDFGTGISFTVSGGTFGTSTLPIAGGNRRFSVADNNMALPVDRAYFAFNHFHNAMNTRFSANMTFGGETASINQYTFGYERTFGDFQNSLEIRTPIFNDYEFTSPTFGVLGGSTGNLFLNYKRVLAQSENAALSGGMGLTIPTGSNALGYIETDVFKIENDAFYFNPFLALVSSSNSGGPCFFHAFAQFDIPINPFDVIIVPDGDPNMAVRAGRLDDKDLFHFDIGGGCWLYQDRPDRFIQALAAILEVHYTAAMGSFDSVTDVTPMNNFIGLGTAFRDAQILNLTTGLHAQLAPLVNLRLAMVYPLRDGSGLNREFDAEFMLSLICYR